MFHGFHANTLSGIFSGFSLPDLFSFLGMSNQTGLLEVRNQDYEITRIVFEKGKILGHSLAWCEPVKAAETPLYPPVEDRSPEDTTQEVIFNLLDRSPIAFDFFKDADISSVARHEPISVNSILLESVKRIDDWRELPKIYRIPEARFEVVSKLSDSTISISLTEWSIWHIIRTKENLAEIWAESPLGSKLETSKAIYGLVTASYVRPLITDIDIDATLLDPVEEEVQGMADSINMNPLFSDASGVYGTSKRPGEAVMRTTGLDINSIFEAEEYIKSHLLEKGPRDAGDGDFMPSMSGRIVELTSSAERKVYNLSKEITTIGREADNDIVIQDNAVSACHAAVVRKDNLFILQDLGSVNGVWVDGKRISRISLADSVDIMIVPFKFRFEMILQDS